MYSFYFSPRSTTKKIAQGITAAWDKPEERDLLTKPLKETVIIPEGEPVLVAMPVYVGRIPAVCREMLTLLKGNGNPAVAVVAYGNRDYDDALLELADVLEAQGFHVVAAGAFIGQHSIYPGVAKGRPDADDRQALGEFGRQCKAAMEGFDATAHSRIAVKGDSDYRSKTPHVVPFKPFGNQNCIKCRACVSRCPMQAIPADDPKKTDGAKCISCGACIYICPVEARGYWSDKFQESAPGFETKCAAYRKPETFFA
ncbi:MAG: 4Fe-4S dicluster domain-containing protein [Clostridia bacterium]|nr:4Fe-4S dicluster domain-containing protein [Clostridia bacterium]